MKKERKDKLNRIIVAVIEEAEKNEEFTQSIGNILIAGDTPANEITKPIPLQKMLSDLLFGATSTRSPKKRKPAKFDPIDVLSNGGEDKLRKSLEDLDVEQLKDIIAEYGMDPSKRAMKWKNKERLINHIFDTAKRRSSKGDAFRDTGGDSN